MAAHDDYEVSLQSDPRYTDTTIINVFKNDYNICSVRMSQDFKDCVQYISHNRDYRSGQYYIELHLGEPIGRRGLHISKADVQGNLADVLQVVEILNFVVFKERELQANLNTLVEPDFAL